MHFHHLINVYYVFKHVYKRYQFLIRSLNFPLQNVCVLFLVYSTAIQEANNVLYDGLIEKLVEVLNVRDPTLTVCFKKKKRNIKNNFSLFIIRILKHQL